MYDKVLDKNASKQSDEDFRKWVVNVLSNWTLNATNRKMATQKFYNFSDE